MSTRRTALAATAASTGADALAGGLPTAPGEYQKAGYDEPDVEVGPSIEKMDLADLLELKAKTDQTTENTVLKNLLKGSRDHTAAFKNQLAR